MIRFYKFFVALSAFLACTATLRSQNIDFPQVPTKGYDVHYYKTTVWLYPTKDSMVGIVEMTATSMGDLPSILQYAKSLTIDSVFVDGVRAGTAVADTISGAYIVSGYPANYH